MLLAGPHLFRSAPAGADGGAFLSIGSIDPRTTGVSADKGVIAIDSSGELWLKVGTGNTAWLNLSDLSGDLVDRITPSSGTDATLSIPSGVDMIHLQGKFDVTVDGAAITARFNGNAADDQGLTYMDVNAGVSGANVNAQFGAARDVANICDLLVLCTGGAKIAVGHVGNASATTVGINQGIAYWANAAALTSFTLRLGAGAFNGSENVFTARKVSL